MGLSSSTFRKLISTLGPHAAAEVGDRIPADLSDGEVPQWDSAAGQFVGATLTPPHDAPYLPDYANQNFVSDLQGLDNGALDNTSLDATFTPLVPDKWVEVQVQVKLETGQASLASVIIDPAGVSRNGAMCRKDASLASVVTQELKCLVPPNTDYQVHLFDQAWLVSITETPSL